MPSIWVFFDLSFTCAFLLFCVERCRFFFAFLQINLLETHLMWLLGIYSHCSLSGVLSLPLVVEQLGIGRLGRAFDNFYLGTEKDFKQNTFFKCMCLWRFYLCIELCWQPYLFQFLLQLCPLYISWDEAQPSSMLESLCVWLRLSPFLPWLQRHQKWFMSCKPCILHIRIPYIQTP